VIRIKKRPLQIGVVEVMEWWSDGVMGRPPGFCVLCFYSPSSSSTGTTSLKMLAVLIGFREIANAGN
jgi:hypothetical protein